MFASILALLGPSVRIIADWMDGENSADMVAAKKAQNLEASRAQITADVAKGDLQAIQKDVSA